MESVMTTGQGQSRGIDLDPLVEKSPRKRVMIVDDEAESVRLLKMILINAGLDVVGATSGKEALQKLPQTTPDVVLLDLMMPEMDGWETFEAMRKITDIPVLIVSAISDKDAVIKGLEIGAEDYVTKPYHPLELVARIKKTLARSNGGAPRRQYEFSDIQLHINLDTNEVNLRGEMVYLPKKIFTLLALLGRNAPEMVSNEAIADELWGSDDETYLKRIKYLIFTLRKYIEVEPSEPKLVVTWGRFGYRLATGTPQKPEA